MRRIEGGRAMGTRMNQTQGMCCLRAVIGSNPCSIALAHSGHTLPTNFAGGLTRRDLLNLRGSSLCLRLVIS